MMKWKCSFILCAIIATPVFAEDIETEGREPAATQKKKKASKKSAQLPKKKLRVENEDPKEVESLIAPEGQAPKVGRKSGADSQEGWIIRRTKDGIIKIPKKETFKFEGGEISGSAQRPSQTVLGSRPSANRYSLLPERRNYKSDILGSAGAGAVVGNPTSGLK
jgi:hypothetical protein